MNRLGLQGEMDEYKGRTQVKRSPNQKTHATKSFVRRTRRTA